MTDVRCAYIYAEQIASLWSAGTSKCVDSWNDGCHQALTFHGFLFSSKCEWYMMPLVTLDSLILRWHYMWWGWRYAHVHSALFPIDAHVCNVASMKDLLGHASACPPSLSCLSSLYLHLYMIYDWHVWRHYVCRHSIRKIFLSQISLVSDISGARTWTRITIRYRDSDFTK